MARFITRVELHNAVWPDDYNKLHAAMQKENFTNTITGSNGTVYELPTAEYYKEGNYSLNDVLESAKKAANTVGKTYGAISSETTSSSWVGLKIAKQ